MKTKLSGMGRGKEIVTFSLNTKQHKTGERRAAVLIACTVPLQPSLISIFHTLFTYLAYISANDCSKVSDATL